MAPPCSPVSQLLWLGPTSVHHRLWLLAFPMRTRADLPWPNAGPPKFRRDPFARDGLFDPGRSAVPRIAALLILRSTIETVSAPAICPFRGSITHPTQPLCTLRGRRYRRLMQHSLPGRLLGLFLGRTCIDRSRQLVWRLPQLRLDLTSRRQDYSFWRGEIR